MPYQENIPQPNDQLSQSQNDILGNFQAIKTLVDINHVTFGGADQGKHKFVTMPEQGAAPATLANEGALYTAQGVYNTEAQLYWRRESNGVVVPFTEGLNANNGWARLPTGALIKWGSQVIPLSNNATDTYSFAWPVGANIPAFAANPYQVYYTVFGSFSEADVSDNASTAAQLKIRVASRVLDVSKVFITTGELVVSDVAYNGWNQFTLSYLAIGI